MLLLTRSASLPSSTLWSTLRSWMIIVVLSGYPGVTATTRESPAHAVLMSVPAVSVFLMRDTTAVQPPISLPAHEVFRISASQRANALRTASSTQVCHAVTLSSSLSSLMWSYLSEIRTWWSLEDPVRHGIGAPLPNSIRTNAQKLSTQNCAAVSPPSPCPSKTPTTASHTPARGTVSTRKRSWSLCFFLPCRSAGICAAEKHTSTRQSTVPLDLVTASPLWNMCWLTPLCLMLAEGGRASGLPILRGRSLGGLCWGEIYGAVCF
mmetsp:Transcript_52487/g.166922  ORF Transcript_52487/g.166922 Transcript_52487/m.166922 type:complete len:265 (-) Transcript_52487:136-930(-)